MSFIFFFQTKVINGFHLHKALHTFMLELKIVHLIKCTFEKHHECKASGFPTVKNLWLCLSVKALCYVKSSVHVYHPLLFSWQMDSCFAPVVTSHFYYPSDGGCSSIICALLCISNLQSRNGLRKLMSDVVSSSVW